MGPGVPHSNEELEGQKGPKKSVFQAGGRRSETRLPRGKRQELGRPIEKTGLHKIGGIAGWGSEKLSGA